MTGTNDQELVASCRNGDKTAYEALVHRHYRRVFAVCLGVLGSAHDAEDTATVTFLAKRPPKKKQKQLDAKQKEREKMLERAMRPRN